MGSINSAQRSLVVWDIRRELPYLKVQRIRGQWISGGEKGLKERSLERQSLERRIF